MSIITDETLAVAQKILSRLAKSGQLRVRDLWKLTVQDSAGVGKTARVLYWLRDRGYVRKCELDYCAPYEITEKGRQFLAALL